MIVNQQVNLRRRRLLRLGGTALLLCASGGGTAVLMGCGGGKEGGGSLAAGPLLPVVTPPGYTRAKVAINWAARSRSVGAPASSLSARATVVGGGASGEDISWVFNRDASRLEAYSEEQTSPVSVTVGTHDFRVEFFAEVGGRGALVGVASARPAIAADGSGIGDITTAGIVTSVVVAPNQSLGIGETKDLVCSARNSDGGNIAVSPGSVTWGVVSGGGVLQVIPSGTATATALGTATVTATVDGKTSPAVTVAVSEIPVPVPSSSPSEGPLASPSPSPLEEFGSLTISAQIGGSVIIGATFVISQEGQVLKTVASTDGENIVLRGGIPAKQTTVTATSPFWGTRTMTQEILPDETTVITLLFGETYSTSVPASYVWDEEIRHIIPLFDPSVHENIRQPYFYGRDNEPPYSLVLPYVYEGRSYELRCHGPSTASPKQYAVRDWSPGDPPGTVLARFNPDRTTFESVRARFPGVLKIESGPEGNRPSLGGIIPGSFDFTLVNDEGRSRRFYGYFQAKYLYYDSFTF